MIRRISPLFVFLALVLPTGFVAQQKPQDTVGETRSAASQDPRSIPFEIYGGLIFVRARLTGSQPLWFILDTGSPVTLISKEQADRKSVV